MTLLVHWNRIDELLGSENRRKFI